MPHEVVTVFFDFLCPYAWRAAELAEAVTTKLGTKFEWSHFSLYQANHKGDDGWQLWNEPLKETSDSGTRGLLPFLASIAARRQGSEAHDAFRISLLRMRYVEHQPYHLTTIHHAAEQAGLHLATFERDLKDPEMRTTLAQDHHRAVNLQVVATPTIRFESGDTAYVRLSEVPSDPNEAVRLFERLRDLLGDYPYIETLRRPRHSGN